MGLFFKSNDQSAEIFVGDQKLLSVSENQSRLGGATTQVEAEPSNFLAGLYQGNPVSQYIPSDIVTPHTVWLDVNPALSIIANVIWAIKEAIDQVEEESEQARNRGVKKITRFQIINYNEMLPEDV